jgi:hypothetical protein
LPVEGLAVTRMRKWECGSRNNLKSEFGMWKAENEAWCIFP